MPHDQASSYCTRAVFSVWHIVGCNTVGYGVLDSKRRHVDLVMILYSDKCLLLQFVEIKSHLFKFHIFIQSANCT